MKACSRLPGTVSDSIVKRLYLSRLRAANARYDARMTLARRRLGGSRSAVAATSDTASAIDIYAIALRRFERARARAQKQLQRRRRNAMRWLDHQGAHEAFRMVHRAQPRRLRSLAKQQQTLHPPAHREAQTSSLIGIASP